jgi:hypothetical protein
MIENAYIPVEAIFTPPPPCRVTIHQAVILRVEHPSLLFQPDFAPQPSSLLHFPRCSSHTPVKPQWTRRAAGTEKLIRTETSLKRVSYFPGSALILAGGRIEKQRANSLT